MSSPFARASTVLRNSARWANGVLLDSIDLDPRSRTDDEFLPWETDGAYGGICGTHYFGDIPHRANLPIVFVHGNTADASAWLPTMAEFMERGDTGEDLWAITFRSPSPSHEAMAEQLDSFVERVLDYTGHDRVHVVSHSLGVTGVRYWLDRFDRYDRVEALVGLAGANHGSSLCRRLARSRIAFGPARSNRFLNPAHLDDPTHPLAELNEDETPGAVDYYTLRATEDRFFRENPQSPALEGATNVAIETDHTGLLTSDETVEYLHDWLRGG